MFKCVSIYVCEGGKIHGARVEVDYCNQVQIEDYIFALFTVSDC